jgi:hypothetical protein
MRDDLSSRHSLQLLTLFVGKMNFDPRFPGHDDLVAVDLAI